VLEPWLKKIREASIPLFTVDAASPSSINVTTSDNFYIGEQLALKLVSDLHGEGNILVFNGFNGVPVMAMRYDQLRAVLKWYPKIRIIQPELCDVIPNTAQDAYSQVSQLLSNRPMPSEKLRSGLAGYRHVVRRHTWIDRPERRRSQPAHTARNPHRTSSHGSG